MPRHILMIAMLAGLVSACQGQSTSAPPTPADTSTTPPAAGTFVLQPGMSANLGGSNSLTFEKIVSDSRCAPGVQCIWAGEVTVAIKLMVGSQSATFQLSTHTSPRYQAKGYSVEFVAYAACPGGGPAVTPLPGECATFRTLASK